ncbi:MAG: hypothetical protein VW683_14510 [Betaproteobacteria bacterium]|jgi:hypothetical protein
MGFFWWLDALLGRESNEAKPSEPVRLANAFDDWGKANPDHRQAAGRTHSALVQAGYATLQDLQVPDEELLNVQGIGAYGLEIIRQIGGRYAED